MPFATVNGLRIYHEWQLHCAWAGPDPHFRAVVEGFKMARLQLGPVRYNQNRREFQGNKPPTPGPER